LLGGPITGERFLISARTRPLRRAGARPGCSSSICWSLTRSGSSRVDLVNELTEPGRAMACAAPAAPLWSWIRCDLSSMLRATAWAGAPRMRPIASRTLATKSGSAESLIVFRGCGCRSRARQLRLISAAPRRQRPQFGAFVLLNSKSASWPVVNPPSIPR
jgi:hypothetical protein